MKGENEGLTIVEERVLEQLSIYRYLTPDQMMRLGVSKDLRHLYNVLERLLGANRTRKEIGELDFGAVPGKGRLARVYYLTKRGARLLERGRKDLMDLPYVERANLFNNDYWHHRYTVDLHMHLRAFSERDGHEVRFFKSYFEFEKQYKRSTSTPMRKGVIVPDAICMLDCADGVERLFVFEMENGSDTGKSEKKIRRYLEALDERAIERAVDADDETPNRVLFVFEHRQTLENLRKRFKGDEQFAYWGDYIFCKTLDSFNETEIRRSTSFRQNWINLISGDHVPLFGKAIT